MCRIDTFRDSPEGSPSSSAVNAFSLTQLLKENNITGGAKDWNPRLEAAGLIERKSRVGSKGLTKHWWSITDEGEKYGKNHISSSNTRDTQPLWYDTTFLDLIALFN